MLAFVHIEKCGGTTLNRMLRRLYCRDHFDIIPRDHDAMLAAPQDLQHLLRMRPNARSLAGHSVRLQCGFEQVVPHIQYVTLLREPVKRYISDFRHFVDILDFPADIEAWLAREDRHNFQTRAIAGCDDPELAMELLEQRFRLVGTVEQYDHFLHQLAGLLGCHPAKLQCQAVNRAADRNRVKPLPDLSRYEEQIRWNNRHDQQLYQFACELQHRRGSAAAEASATLPPPNVAARCAGTARQWVHLFYRNLIYKPSVGHLPIPHALKTYRQAS